jgi:hypothetical protein
MDRRRVVIMGAAGRDFPAVAPPICEADGTERWDSSGMDVADAFIVRNGMLVLASGGLPQEFWSRRLSPGF